jgi:hypothetical protein
MMLQRGHCNTMPYPHHSVVKERKRETTGDLGRWMVSGQKTVFCRVLVP